MFWVGTLLQADYHALLFLLTETKRQLTRALKASWLILTLEACAACCLNLELEQEDKVFLVSLTIGRSQRYRYRAKRWV